MRNLFFQGLLILLHFVTYKLLLLYRLRVPITFTHEFLGVFYYDLLIGLLLLCMRPIHKKLFRGIVTFTMALYSANFILYPYLHNWIGFKDWHHLFHADIYYSSVRDSLILKGVFFALLLPLTYWYFSSLFERLYSNPIKIKRAVMIAASILLAFPMTLNAPQAGSFKWNPLAYLVFTSSNGDLSHPTQLTVGQNIDPQTVGKKIQTALSAEDEILTRSKTIPMNVVLIMLESLGNVSRQREGGQPMPFFDELCQKGVYFENAYAPYPLTMKTLFSVLTGEYPSAEEKVIGEINPNIKIDTLSQYFHQKNYKSALIHGSYFRYQYKLPFLNNRGFDTLIDAKDLTDTTDILNSWGVEDASVYRNAKSWIETDDNPFFLVLLPLFAHHPYDVPSSFLKTFPEKTSLDRYHNALRYGDEQLKVFVQYLIDSGVMDNTLLIVFGDHGEAFMQHDRNIAHAGYLYEENIQVPLLYYSPKILQQPRHYQEPVSVTSIFKTVLKIDQLASSMGDAGESEIIFPKPPSELVYFHTSVGRDISGLRDGPWKYIYEYPTDQSLLFNLNNDPFEKKNIYFDHVERAEDYKKKVQSHRIFTTNKIQLSERY